MLAYRISDLAIIPTQVTLCPHHVGRGIVEMQLHGFLSLALDMQVVIFTAGEWGPNTDSVGGWGPRKHAGQFCEQKNLLSIGNQTIPWSFIL